jgi:predicted O-linked N-acetylglucosamine transferase (SPINDLY family)
VLQSLNQVNLTLSELHEFRLSIVRNEQWSAVSVTDVHIEGLEGIGLLIRRSSLLWADFETLRERVARQTLNNARTTKKYFVDHFISSTPITQQEQEVAFQTSSLRLGPILPFDSMMYSMTMEDRMLIAEATSILNFNVQDFTVQQRQNRREDTRREYPLQSLRIGLISYDFNDHPTTHLIEGIFRWIQSFRAGCTSLNSSTTCWYGLISLFVYAYGADDQSYYRRMLVKEADFFFDVAMLSHSDLFDKIHNRDSIDILFDMQLHTLGNRMELSSLRPAPVMVNYLVFPGTSGAKCFDYIIADSVVLPVEAVRHYSERVVYLPPTYQISFYNDEHLQLWNVADDALGQSTLSSKPQMSAMQHRVQQHKMMLRR